MLAELFKENEPDRSTAELLEKLFIGKDQTKFREFVNLVDRLISLMEPNTSINQVSTTWDITVKTLHRIKQRLHENQVAQIGKPTYSNSVMGGKLTPYPIASAILASPNIKVSAQYQGLCLLLIFHLLKNGSPARIAPF